ncbi:hypothetical protein SCHPADRAFT_1002396 [Schizopora paradoxa]|uniref:Uncharacterized protein n=1 Tax=Schizopora paradoxa TaxID=27342 RepID=A0A0H2RA38_9AGAM|nr:hypothetical protein SCHPADRAFT_1002396 [Schizopora paradoxa]
MKADSSFEEDQRTLFNGDDDKFEQITSANTSTVTVAANPGYTNLEGHDQWTTQNYAFGITFEYEEDRLRESGSWPVFEKKFLRDFAKLDFEVPMPQKERVVRISKSKIFVYWLRYGRIAPKNIRNVWNKLLKSVKNHSTESLEYIGRECGMHKLYLHKIKRISGNSLEHVLKDYVYTIDDGRLIRLYDVRNDHTHVKAETEELLQQFEATHPVKQEDLDRKPLQIVGVASKILPLKPCVESAKDASSPLHKKKVWRDFGKGTVESMLDSRRDGGRIQTQNIKPESGVDLRDIRVGTGLPAKPSSGVLTGIVDEKRIGQDKRMRDRQLRREAQSLALSQRMYLVGSSPQDNTQIVTIGDFIEMFTKKALDAAPLTLTVPKIDRAF